MRQFLGFKKKIVFFLMKKIAMYLKHLIVTPITLKVNQSNNKTIETNVKVQ